MSDISSDKYLIHIGHKAAEEYLAHHGVLGMKWGIRKDGKPQGWQGGSGKNVISKLRSDPIKEDSSSSLSDGMKWGATSKKNSRRSYIDIMDAAGSPSREKFATNFPEDKNLAAVKAVWVVDKWDIADEIDYKYAEKFDFIEDAPYPDNFKELKELTSNQKKVYKSMLKDLDVSFKDHDNKALKELDSIKDETLSKSDKIIKDELREEIIRDSEDWNSIYSEAMKVLEHSQQVLIDNGRSVTDEFLVHHGVLGMKWGIRKDGKPQGWQGGSGKKAAKAVGSGAKKVAKGTAKAAVKSRAAINKARTIRNERKQLEEARLDELKLEDKKRRLASSYSIASTTRSARTLSRHMDSLNDAELKSRINRLKLENEVRELSRQERERSRSWVSKALEESAKNSVKSVSTYGMTKAGRMAIDGFFDEMTKQSDKSSNSKSSTSSDNKTKTDSSWSNKIPKKTAKSYGSTNRNKTYGASSGRTRSSGPYGSTKYNKAYGASSRSQTRSTPLLTSSSRFDDVYYEVPDDYK